MPELAQIDHLGALVRQLDADDVAPGHDGDARRNGAHRAGDVVGQADDARGLDAGRGLELVERHHRPGPHLDDLAAHAEILEHGFEQPRVLLQRFLVDRGGLGRRHLAQQIERRQQMLARGAQIEARLARGIGPLARRRRRGRPTAVRRGGGGGGFRLAVVCRLGRCVELRLAAQRQASSSIAAAAWRHGGDAARERGR